jgi:hypothetical protein
MRRSVLFLSPLLALGCVSSNATHPNEHTGYDGGTTAPLSCVPNLDGDITSAEAQAVVGVAVKYLVSPKGENRPVDLAGSVDSSGHLVWDFGTDYADDQVAQIEATPVTGKWYASSFPNGQFVTPFDAGDTVEAVYSQDDQAIWLQGLASAQESPPQGQTLLVYQQPIALYRFPLTAGSTWTSIGTIANGMLDGLPWAEEDTYQATDDATGQMILPDFTFTQAHRVRFTVTLVPAAGQTQVTRQASFMFECFGEIARATSLPGETNDDFTTAAEIRRFGAQ